jgi:hypothetical protein
MMWRLWQCSRETSSVSRTSLRASRSRKEQTHLLWVDLGRALKDPLEQADAETKAAIAGGGRSIDDLVHRLKRDVLETLEVARRVIGAEDTVHAANAALQAA